VPVRRQRPFCRASYANQRCPAVPLLLGSTDVSASHLAQTTEECTDWPTRKDSLHTQRLRSGRAGKDAVVVADASACGQRNKRFCLLLPMLVRSAAYSRGPHSYVLSYVGLDYLVSCHDKRYSRSNVCSRFSAKCSRTGCARRSSCSGHLRRDWSVRVICVMIGRLCARRG